MSVLVGVPARDCAVWVSRFLGELEKLSGISRVVFYYSPGRDPTLTMLKEWAEEAPHLVEIYEEPMMRALSSAQLAPIYKELQEIMKEGDETHFMTIDTDIMKMPENLIQYLIKQKKDIVAPYVWVENSKPPMFYDTNIFRYKEQRFHPFDPPTAEKAFEVDSVGTCFLTSREAFLSTPIENPYPHRNFCDNARQLGFKVWADPRIKIYHLNKFPLGLLLPLELVFPLPLEALQGKQRDQTPYIKKSGLTTTVDELPNDLIEALVWGRVTDEDKDFIYFK